MPDLLARSTHEARAAELLSGTLERQRRRLAADVQAGREPTEADWNVYSDELVVVYLLLLGGPWFSSYWGLAGRWSVFESGDRIGDRYRSWAGVHAANEAKRIIDGSKSIVAEARAEIDSIRRQLSALPASPSPAAVAELEARLNATGLVPEVSATNRAIRYGVSAVTDAASAGEFAVRDAFNDSAANAPTDGQRRVLKMVAYWSTERDGRVCPICRPLDGQPESVWVERFPSGPKAHDMCRCFLEWRVE